MNHEFLHEKAKTGINFNTNKTIRMCVFLQCSTPARHSQWNSPFKFSW